MPPVASAVQVWESMGAGPGRVFRFSGGAGLASGERRSMLLVKEEGQILPVRFANSESFELRIHARSPWGRGSGDVSTEG